YTRLLARTLGREFVALRSGLFQLQLLGYFDTVEAVVGLPLSGEDVVPHRACVLSTTRVFDALICLGTGHEQARHLIRLVRLGDGIGVRMYLTNICDPQLLSLGDVAQLYARSFDIEMAFRLLKEYLGMSH